MASTISKVKQKLKQVKYRHLKAYLSDNLKADPRNCTHNEISTSINGEVGTCAYEGSSIYGTVCDTTFGKDQSQECGLFCPKRSKEELKREFYAFIDNSSIGEVAKEFPDVTALIWVLSTVGADESDIDLEEHYEKIEKLTVENHHLSTIVEDLKKLLALHTAEIQNFESDNKDLIVRVEELNAELKSSKHTLSVEIELSLWQRFMRWLR